MEIKPKIGFEKIKFGMNREEIINILGEPDRIVTDENDEDEQRLEWNHLKIRLTFEADNRFSYFTCKNLNLQYAGQTFMDMEINQAKKEIFGTVISVWEVDDYDSFQTHFDEKLWLTLHSEYGKVSEFEMGVPFQSETEYDWPE